jgi:hypothetical protein
MKSMNTVNETTLDGEAAAHPAGVKRGPLEASITWLRISFYLGALADALMTVALVTPALWGWMLKIDNFAPDLRYRVDMGIGAALMLGWTILLLWGARRPLERKGVLLLTVIPVICGLFTAAVAGVVTGLSPLSASLTVLVFLPLLAGLLLFSYVKARRAEAAAGAAAVRSAEERS